MTATTAGERRPASTRGGNSRRHLAYDLGYRGEPLPAWAEDHPTLIDAWEDGVSDRDRAGGDTQPAGGPKKPKAEPAASEPASATRTPATGDSSPTPEPSRSSASGLPSLRMPRSTSIETVSDSLGSVLVGLVGYAIVINAIRGGWTGVKQWLSAKFTNGDGSLP